MVRRDRLAPASRSLLFYTPPCQSFHSDERENENAGCDDPDVKVETIMRTLSTLFTSGLLILLVGVLPAHADDIGDIRALFAEFARDVQTKEFDKTLLLESPDYTSKTDNHKPINGKQAVVEMKSEGVARVKEMSFAIQYVSLKKNSAKVSTTFVYTYITVDPKLAAGSKLREHEMSIRGANESYLSKSGAGWKLKSMETHRSVVAMDGKLMGGKK